jgi:tetratricopeptide (TPR) repeat protein/CHAT domain-containing protein
MKPESGHVRFSRRVGFVFVMEAILAIAADQCSVLAAAESPPAAPDSEPQGSNNVAPSEARLPSTTGQTGTTRTSQNEPPPTEASENELASEQLRTFRREYLQQVNQFDREGKLSDAIAAAERLLKIETAMLGRNHPDVAQTLRRLADFHLARDDFEGAEARRKEVLDIVAQVYGASHWETTEARLALEDTRIQAGLDAADRTRLKAAKRREGEARQCCQQGQFAQAIRIYDGIPELRRKLLGETHPEYARSLIDLGAFCCFAGDFSRAERLDQEAVDILKKVVGEQHPGYAIALNNLAGLYAERGDPARAEPLHRKALEIRKQVLGPTHPHYAQSLQGLAGVYREMGDLARAEPLFREAVEINREALGERHTRFALALINLGAIYRDTDDWRRAEPLLRQAVDILRESVGDKHPDYAKSLDNLASLYRSMSQYTRAMPLLREALEIEKATVGEKHPSYAITLNDLGAVYESLGEYERAASLYEAALELDRDVFGEQHPYYAIGLNNLAGILQSLGNYDRADALLRESIEVTKATLGDRHPDYANSLHNLASLCGEMSDYTAAESLLQQALEIKKATVGARNPDYANSLSNLGFLYRKMGNYPRAESTLRQAREITMATLGDRHSQYATCLNNLGSLYALMGDYARAEPLLRQSLEITRAALGENHPDCAGVLNGLGSLYTSMGDYVQAESLLRQSAKIMKATVGEKHPKYANTLNLLAMLHSSITDYVHAEQLWQEALEIRKEALGVKHPDYASSLSNLGSAYESMHEYARAESMLLESLEITEATVGKKHPDYATVLNNLGVVYHKMGQVDRAESVYRAALEIKRELLGPKHDSCGETLANLAAVHQATGNYQASETLLREALEIRYTLFRETISALPERQQLAMARRLRWPLDAYLTLVLDARLPSEDAFKHALSWKGAVFVQQYQARIRRDQQELIPLLEQLQTTASQLATLALATPGPGQRESWTHQMADLTERKERLQAELGLKSEAFRDLQATRDVTVAELQAALSKEAILVDFLEYMHFSSQTGERENHLAAFVVTHDKPVLCLELGAAAPIQQAIDRWRRANVEVTPMVEVQPGRVQETVSQENAGRGVDISRPTELPSNYGGQLEPPERVLRRLIWEPLDEHIAAAQMVIASPDGILSDCPLAALPGKTPGKYLLEEVPIAVIAVPQMLPSLLSKPSAQDVPQATRSMLLVGDVNFDARPDELPAAGSLGLSGRGAARGNRRLTFAPLSATTAEVKSVGELFRQAEREATLDVISGSQATEAEFRGRAPGHRYLHLATHGFFAPPEVHSALAVLPLEPKGLLAGTNPRPRLEQTIAGFHPGLLSGLALAGANVGAQPTAIPGELTDDGILTASEVTELDLRSTDLVVLSACETGLGAVAGGQGVLGLQRAFQLAGARTVVASLWKVDDEATRKLMERFYQNLWQKKMGKLAALREAQLWTLRAGHKSSELGAARSLRLDEPIAVSPGSPRLPPAYWAAFVLSGDWR